MIKNKYHSQKANGNIKHSRVDSEIFFRVEERRMGKLNIIYLL